MRKTAKKNKLATACRKLIKQNIEKIRNALDPKNIMTFELGQLIIISVVTVTIAWFVLLNSATVQKLALAASNADYIIVALESGGKDVLQLTEEYEAAEDKSTAATPYASVNLPEYYNIEADKMAPGTSGKIVLYITRRAPIVTMCSLYPVIEPVFAKEGLNQIKPAEEGETLTDDQQELLDRKEMLTNLLNGHIRFYATRTENRDKNGKLVSYTYADPITEDSRLKVVWKKKYSPNGSEEDTEEDTEDTGSLPGSVGHALLTHNGKVAGSGAGGEEDTEDTGSGSTAAKNPEELTATIYWVWFYDYDDVPAKERNLHDVYIDAATGDVVSSAGDGVYTFSLPKEPKFWFDFSDYDSADANNKKIFRDVVENPHVDTAFQDFVDMHYDYADTRIGQEVKTISFRVYVDALYDGNGYVVP